MSESNVCKHGRIRRQCADCEVAELYKEISAKDAVILAQAKGIVSLDQQLELAVKALEEIDELITDSDISAGTIARNTLSSIQSLSEGSETP